MKLNIAMLSYHTCPLATLGGKDTGGMNVYVRDLTQSLGRSGIHVDVYTRSQDEHVPHILHDLGYGNRVVHIPAGPETPLPKKTLAEHIPAFSQEILGLSKRKSLQYDIIHSNYWMSGLAAKSLKREWNVPIIHMFHTLSQMKNQVARDDSEIEGSYRLDGEYDILRNADQIIAATQAEKEQLISLYQANENKIAIIPPGVDTSRFYPIPTEEAKDYIGIRPEDRMILFVGRIEPLKGIETLIRAISIIRDSEVMIDCPHHLVIIGGEPDLSKNCINSEMARIQKLSRDMGLEDLVIFLGKRDQDTLPYYYSAAEIVVVPSHYESFGMVALEAMACGTPVIASQVGGLAYLVQDGNTGFFVQDGNPQDLSARLKQLICQDELRYDFGKQAYLYAQDYSWDKIAKIIVNKYRDVISEYKKHRNT